MSAFRTIASCLFLTTLCVVGWSTGARAQINPFQGYKGPVLSKEDLAAGRVAGSKLLHDDHADVGTSEAWIGPSSGNRGAVSVVRVFQKKGMDCRTLKSEIHYKKAATSPRVLNLDVCQLPNGDWKLM